MRKLKGEETCVDQLSYQTGRQPSRLENESRPEIVEIKEIRELAEEGTPRRLRKESEKHAAGGRLGRCPSSAD